MLHIVPEAVEVPGRCAVSQSETGPFYDTQVTIPRHGRLYLSIPWLNSVAADLGLVPASELHDALEDLDGSLEAQQALTGRVERFEADVQNVCGGLIRFLTIQRSRESLLEELAAAREAVDRLTERVDALEPPEAG